MDRGRGEVEEVCRSGVAVHARWTGLIVADGYAKEVLNVTPDDVFVGSPPLAFTFGLGGLLLFPLSIGAATLLVEQPSPTQLLPAIAEAGASVLFTAPTSYRAMAAKAAEAHIAAGQGVTRGTVCRHLIRAVHDAEDVDDVLGFRAVIVAAQSVAERL